MTSVAAPTKSTSFRMSYEAFLDWLPEDAHAEWVSGEVIIFMPSKSYHQHLVLFLGALLRQFALLLNRGVVIVAPFQMRLAQSGREPDVVFVAHDHRHRLSENRLDGPADLVIEVVSDDSVHRDRQVKFHEYQEAGVREYWIIDPRPGKQRADFYRLNEDGQYILYGIDEDERVESEVLPGFWLRPNWLWAAETLDAFTCLMENELIAEMLRARVNETDKS